MRLTARGVWDEYRISQRLNAEERDNSMTPRNTISKDKARDPLYPPNTAVELTSIFMSTAAVVRTVPGLVSRVHMVSAIPDDANKYEYEVTIRVREQDIQPERVWRKFTGNEQELRSIMVGDTVRARHTSSASYLTATDTTVTIGGVSDTFRSITEGDPANTGYITRPFSFNWWSHT